MKFSMLSVAAAILTIPVVPASAQPPRTITVNGQAEIKVAPDEVLITAGVETDDLDITKAREANDARIKAVVAAVTAQGVRQADIRSEFLDIQPRYKDEYERRTFLGYFARRSLSVTLKDTSRFDAVISALLTAGANYLHGIEFRTSELRRHRDEARTLAMRAAREKAQLLVAALDGRIGAPTSIQEGHSGWWSPYNTWWGGRYSTAAYQNVVQDRRAATAGDETLVPGQISVTASVTVTFELHAGK